MDIDIQVVLINLLCIHLKILGKAMNEISKNVIKITVCVSPDLLFVFG